MTALDYFDRDRNVGGYVKPSREQPDSDSLYHYYKPLDPDVAHGWATREAIGAIFMCLLVAIPSTFGSVALASRFWTVPTDSVIDIIGKLGVALMGGMLFPFAWPFRFLWVSPWRAYRDTLAECRATRRAYDRVAIHRLRQPKPQALSERIVGVERSEVDPLDELYRQCALVLIRARHDATVPRNAQESITHNVDGVIIKVNKENYPRIAGVLCELGFMTGGAGKAYALTDEWSRADNDTLLYALKARKHLIKMRHKRGDSESWQG